MNEEILGLLGVSPEQMQQYQQQQNLAGLQALGNALIQAGAPRQGGRVSTLVGLGQAAPALQQGRAQEMDNILRGLLQRRQIEQMAAEAKKPSFMTIKTADGGERLVKIGPDSAVSPVNIPGLSMGAGPKFDPATTAFLSFRYPGKSFVELTPAQQQEIIEFSNAPNAEKAAELRRESEKTQFDTGIKTPVPRGRAEFLSPTTSLPVTPVRPLSSTPAGPPLAGSLDATLANVQQVAATPVSKDMTPRSMQETAVKMSSDVASKPLGEKEKPLIDSAAISPKAKQELLLIQPKQTQAVEYVLETNSQMLSVIDELLSNEGFDDAFGFLGETISNVPGTNAARVRALLERLGGNLFIEAITAMRAASATGAAVGSVTEKEGDKLQGSRAALMQAQKAADARRELETLRDTLQFQRNMVTNAYERTYGRGSFVQRSPQKSPEQRKSLESIFRK